MVGDSDTKRILELVGSVLRDYWGGYIPPATLFVRGVDTEETRVRGRDGESAMGLGDGVMILEGGEVIL